MFRVQMKIKGLRRRTSKKSASSGSCSCILLRTAEADWSDTRSGHSKQRVRFGGGREGGASIPICTCIAGLNQVVKSFISITSPSISGAFFLNYHT